MSELCVWKWGDTRKVDNQRPFTSAVCVNLALSPLTLDPQHPPEKMNLWLDEMQFSAVLRGLLALFSLFLVYILSRSQFLPTLHLPSLFLCKVFFTNYSTHFYKVGSVSHNHCGSASGLWLYPLTWWRLLYCTTVEKSTLHIWKIGDKILQVIEG